MDKMGNTGGKVGLFIGRFQPLHNGHVQAIKECASKVNVLWIGIGSMEKSRETENPWSFRERVWMVRRVLKAEGVENYSLFGIQDYADDETWVGEIVKKVGRKRENGIDVVFTGNSWTAETFEKQGFLVEKLRLYGQFSATKVRDAFLMREGWQSMVPVVLHSFLNNRLPKGKRKGKTESKSF